MTPFYVYILFKGERIIYVGMTCNLKKRLQEHSDRNFSSFETKKFSSKKHASECERWMIQMIDAPANRRVIKIGDTRKRASFALTADLKKRLERAASKAVPKATFSQYLERIVEEVAQQKGI